MSLEAYDKVAHALEVARERYSNADLLRAGVLAIPYIGSGIDLLLTEGVRRDAEERTRFLLLSLREDVSSLQEEKVDRAFLESEEFRDLLFKAFVSSARSRSREKIRINARILAGAIHLKARDGHDVELYLDLISGLDGEDLRILRRIIESQTPAFDSREDKKTHYEWAVDRTWKKIHDLLGGIRHEQMIYRALHLHAAGYLQELSPPEQNSFRAFVLSPIMGSLVYWLGQFGGFPTDEDIRRVQKKVDEKAI